MSIKKQSLFLGLSNVLSLGLNFLSGILLTRLLGPEGRGVLSKVEAGAGLLAQLTTLKSHMGFIFFVANKKIDSKKLFGIAVLIIFGSLLLSCLILWIVVSTGSASLFLPLDYISTFFIFYCLILFFFTESQVILSAFLRGAKVFKDVYLNQIIVAIFRLLLFASVFLFFKESFTNLESALLLHLLVLLLSLFTTIYFFRRKFNIRPSLRLSRSKEINPFFSFVSLSYLSLMANFLMKSVDIWIVEYYEGPVELGFYAVGVNLSALLMVFPSTVREVFIPYVASGDRTENIKNLKFFSRLSFSGILTIAVAIFFLADYLVPMLYGSEFINSIQPFKYLLFAITVASVGIIFSSYNYGSGSPKLNFYANVISLIIMIALDFILIPNYGIEGAAIASLITYFINSILIISTVMYTQKLPFANYLFVTLKDLKELRRFSFRK